MKPLSQQGRVSHRFISNFATHTFIWLATTFTLLSIVATPAPLSAQEEHPPHIQALDGEWVFVEDRTEGRAVEMGGAPMSPRFRLRVEKDAVIYPRPRGDERITLDGSVIEKTEYEGYITRYQGEVKKDWLEYTMKRERLVDKEITHVLKRVFRITEDGLLVYIFSNKAKKQLALYRHPEDIKLPAPKNATIADMAWLADTWISLKNTSSTEECWIPPKGGAMLGISRTVKGEKMGGFEFLRIVERDEGLVYIAQPGGRSATEFVLTKLDKNRAVFVNPRHNYPQRIIYELSHDNILTASIGFAIGRLQSYEFKRIEK